MLRRIFLTRCPLEIGLRRLQVVPLGHRDRIPDPVANRLDGMDLREVGFTAGAEIVKQLRPGLHPGPVDDLEQPGSQVRVGIPVTRDDEFALVAIQFVSFLQVWSKFGEDRDNSLGLSFMMFRLARPDCHSGPFPVHVLPSQGEMLTRTPQPGEPTQGEQQSPFGVRAGIQNGFRCFNSDIGLPLLIAARGGGNVALLERIGFDQFTVQGIGEELFGNSAGPADGVLCQPFADQVLPESFGRGLRDRSERRRSVEMCQQVLPGPLPDRLCRWLGVVPAGDVFIDKRLQAGRSTRSHQPHTGQLRIESRFQLANILRRFRFNRELGNHSDQQLLDMPLKRCRILGCHFAEIDCLADTRRVRELELPQSLGIG
ncbi:MAG: hypothetical protein U0929_17340 [Planctomycetaceae bacterium]